MHEILNVWGKLFECYYQHLFFIGEREGEEHVESRGKAEDQTSHRQRPYVFQAVL